MAELLINGIVLRGNEPQCAELCRSEWAAEQPVLQPWALPVAIQESIALVESAPVQEHRVETPEPAVGLLVAVGLTAIWRRRR